MGATGSLCVWRHSFPNRWRPSSSKEEWGQAAAASTASTVWDIHMAAAMRLIPDNPLLTSWLLLKDGLHPSHVFLADTSKKSQLSHDYAFIKCQWRWFMLSFCWLWLVTSFFFLHVFSNGFLAPGILRAPLVLHKFSLETLVKENKFSNASQWSFLLIFVS